MTGQTSFAAIRENSMTRKKSPTARTLEELRRLGYVADVVERNLPRCFIKKDFLGFADLLAVHPDEWGVLAIQTTTMDNASKRERKIRDEPRAAAWLKAGNRIEVWAWRLMGARGERKLWKLERRQVA